MPGPNLLPNGDYELVVTASDGLELTTSRFQLRRLGGPVTATVTSRPLAAAMSDTPSATGKGNAAAVSDSAPMESTETSKEQHDLAITSAWTSLISGTSPADTGKKQGNADWSIENGALVGVVSGQMGKLELCPKVPNQFHVRCEMRVLGSGNSGFDIIMENASREFLRGYHVDFGPERTGMIAQLGEWKILQQAGNVDVKANEWTRLEIIKTASTLTAIINGSRGADVPIVDGEFTRVDLELDARDGESRVEVRNLELRDIADDLPAPSENLSLKFDGARSYVSIPTLSRNGPEPYTLEAWILPHYRNVDEVPVAISGELTLQIGKGARGFYPIESYSPFAHGDPVKTSNEWVHVAIVVEVQEVRLYIDGKETHRLPRRAEVANVRYAFGGTWMGAHPDPDHPDYAQLSYHFLGHIDEVRMSSVARYQHAFVPAARFDCDADTLALYHCDEGSGKELRDSSGYNHHGVMFNVEWELHDTADPHLVAARNQEQAAQQFSLPVEMSSKAGMKLRLIPPGEFLMGAPENDVDASPEEKPQHRVKLTKPFYMGTTEVTVGQFRQFVEATSYVTQAESDDKGAFTVQEQARKEAMVWHRMDDNRDKKDDNLPVRGVSWEDARRFCEWLTESESMTYRLPTEAEWEYACRAGSTTRYSFGDLIDEQRVSGRIEGRPGPLHAVARFPPNAFGLFDMHGNLNEICLDSGRLFTADDISDPVGSLDPTQPAVVRGGACSSAPFRLRSSQRYLNDSRSFPGDNFATIVKGFRVVAVPSRATGE